MQNGTAAKQVRDLCHAGCLVQSGLGTSATAAVQVDPLPGVNSWNRGCGHTAIATARSRQKGGIRNWFLCALICGAERPCMLCATVQGRRHDATHGPVQVREQRWPCRAACLRDSACIHTLGFKKCGPCPPPPQSPSCALPPQHLLRPVAPVLDSSSTAPSPP
jgi:hypothetical protein